jgi:hypothetical protein
MAGAQKEALSDLLETRYTTRDNFSLHHLNKPHQPCYCGFSGTPTIKIS